MMIAGRLFGNGIRAVCTIIPTQYFIVELRSAIVNTEAARSLVAVCIEEWATGGSRYLFKLITLKLKSTIQLIKCRKNCYI